MIQAQDEAGGAAGKPTVASLHAMMDKVLKRPVPPPDYDAEDLFFGAFDIEPGPQQLAMLQKVLELDPGYADALHGVLPYIERTDEENLALLQKIVAVAEWRMGPKAFKEYAEIFWGVLETRPYMRARAALAAALRGLGRTEEAVGHWEEMLELNLEDNQGMRYELMNGYLQLGRVDDATKLFKRYDECDSSVSFAWGRVLHRFLRRRLKDAGAALIKAREQNRHMEAFLTGAKPLPAKQPDYYEPGSVAEAQSFADGIVSAWKAHPEAIEWLRQNAVARPKARKRARGGDA